MKPLPQEYYIQDAPTLAKDLIGKMLFTHFNGELCGGKIVETEAYAGATDQASHAYGMRRTHRTEVMYSQGGVAYVYLCYGIHCLLNVVTQQENVPHAVLISGLEPVMGIETMLKRRNLASLKKNVSNGPGSLAKALGVSLQANGLSLQGPHIWIEEGSGLDTNILASKRINIDYAKEDANLPWRFLLQDSIWTRPLRV